MGRFVRGGRFVPAESLRALADAEVIVARAEAAAREVLDAARAEGDRLLQVARQAGLEQGRAEAAAHLVRAGVERARMLDEVQRDVVGLALDVARKLIGREVEASPELVVDLCSRAVSRAVTARSVVLKVNPVDLAVVQQRLDRLAAGIPVGLGVTLAGDDSVTRGGCVVDSEMGRIDARLETQLDAIERALLEGDDA